MRSRWGETVLALENLAIKRISKLVELNNRIAELASFETGIEVIIANACRIVDFSRLLGGTHGSHESDRIDRFCLEKP